MNITAVIPARLDSSRLPNKLLMDICGKSLIIRTYESALKSNLFNDVIVVTNSKLIKEELNKNDVNYIFKNKEYETGTDRIADVSDEINSEIIINIQGDEPFINSKTLKLIIDKFLKDDEKSINVISVMSRFTSNYDLENPNNVKVITDENQNAIYFSRSIIPFKRNDSSINYFKHVGVYAFRKSFLTKFSNLKIGVLETAEKIEALRMVENGTAIKMIESDEKFIGIDTLEDLEMARKMINEKGSI